MGCCTAIPFAKQLAFANFFWSSLHGHRGPGHVPIYGNIYGLNRMINWSIIGFGMIWGIPKSIIYPLFIHIFHNIPFLYGPNYPFSSYRYPKTHFRCSPAAPPAAEAHQLSPVAPRYGPGAGSVRSPSGDHLGDVIWSVWSDLQHTLHYITLHYVTLHYITLHYITFITLHYITLHYITLHYITYITLHYITLH